MQLTHYGRFSPFSFLFFILPLFLFLLLFIRPSPPSLCSFSQSPLSLYLLSPCSIPSPILLFLLSFFLCLLYSTFSFSSTSYFLPPSTSSCFSFSTFSSFLPPPPSLSQPSDPIINRESQIKPLVWHEKNSIYWIIQWTPLAFEFLWIQAKSRHCTHRGGSSFLLRGGFDQNNDDAEHRPRAAKRRPDFFGGVYLNPVSDVFLASIKGNTKFWYGEMN